LTVRLQGANENPKSERQRSGIPYLAKNEREMGTRGSVDGPNARAVRTWGRPEPRRLVVLDPDSADLFWKNVRTKRTKRTKYPLTHTRLGESVRLKRPMRHKPPGSELKAEETGRFALLICARFLRPRPVSGQVVTSNCQRSADLRRTHWAHPCLLRSLLLPLWLPW
jgi:hypothetical protein